MPSITTPRIILTAIAFLAITLPAYAACPTRKRNLAEQPEPQAQPKTPRFAIAGTIDLDGDGQSDLPLIRKLIAASGGVIDAEFDIGGNPTGRLRKDTNYLILGNIPPTAEMSPQVAQQFDTLMRQAKERNLRVIHADRLLQWGPARNRAESGEVSRRFRQRPPLGRGRGASAY